MEGSLNVSSSLCIFCFNKTDQLFKTLVNYQVDIQNRFFTLVGRHLNENDKREGIGQKLEKQLSSMILGDDNSEIVFSTGKDRELLVCQHCVTIMKRFSDLYHEMKCLELQVNWQIEQLFDVMMCTDRDTSRMHQLSEVARKDSHVSTAKLLGLRQNLKRWFKTHKNKTAPRVLISPPHLQTNLDDDTQPVSIKKSLRSRRDIAFKTGVDRGLTLPDPELMFMENASLVSLENSLEGQSKDGRYVRTSQRLRKHTKQKAESDDSSEDWNPSADMEKPSYKCIVCAKQFDLRVKLNRHQTCEHPEIFSKTNNFSCTACTKSYPMRHVLDRHVVLCHPEIPLSPSKSPHCSNEEFKKYVVHLLQKEAEAFRRQKSCDTTTTGSKNIVITCECPYCSTRICSNRAGAELHLVKMHFEILSNKLEELQNTMKPQQLPNYFPYYVRPTRKFVPRSFSSPELKQNESGVNGKDQDFGRKLKQLQGKLDQGFEPSEDNNTPSPSNLRKRKHVPSTSAVVPSHLDGIKALPASSTTTSTQIFSCTVCAKGFPFRSRLTAHLASYHPEVCFAYVKSQHVSSEQFKGLIAYVLKQELGSFKVNSGSNVNEIHGAKSQCPYCSKPFLSIAATRKWFLQSHLIQMHSEKVATKLEELQCNMDEDVGLLPKTGRGNAASTTTTDDTPADDDLDLDVAPKTSKDRSPSFVCEVCSNTFQEEHGFKWHKAKEHPETLFIPFKSHHVSIDQFKTYVEDIITHEADSIRQSYDDNTNGKDSFKCPHCPKNLVSKISTQAHMITVHIDILGRKLEELQRQTRPDELETYSASTTVPLPAVLKHYPSSEEEEEFSAIQCHDEKTECNDLVTDDNLHHDILCKAEQDEHLPEMILPD